MKKVMELDETPIRLSQLTILKKVADDYSHLEEDYILTKITSASTRFEDPVARRFDGLTMFISVKGTLKETITETLGDYRRAELNPVHSAGHGLQAPRLGGGGTGSIPALPLHPFHQ